jgi:hypothetical protein
MAVISIGRAVSRQISFATFANGGGCARAANERAIVERIE